MLTLASAANALSSMICMCVTDSFPLASQGPCPNPWHPVSLLASSWISLQSSLPGVFYVLLRDIPSKTVVQSETREQGWEAIYLYGSIPGRPGAVYFTLVLPMGMVHQ